MSDTCQVTLPMEEYEAVKQSEAVVIREYDLADGSRVGKIVAWGDADEMQDIADTPGIYIVPAGTSIACQIMKRVAELLPPDEEQTNGTTGSDQTTDQS